MILMNNCYVLALVSIPGLFAASLVDKGVPVPLQENIDYNTIRDHAINKSLAENVIPVNTTVYNIPVDVIESTGSTEKMPTDDTNEEQVGPQQTMPSPDTGHKEGSHVSPIMAPLVYSWNMVQYYGGKLAKHWHGFSVHNSSLDFGPVHLHNGSFSFNKHNTTIAWTPFGKGDSKLSWSTPGAHDSKLSWDPFSIAGQSSNFSFYPFFNKTKNYISNVYHSLPHVINGTGFKGIQQMTQHIEHDGEPGIHHSSTFVIQH